MVVGIFGKKQELKGQQFVMPSQDTRLCKGCGRLLEKEVLVCPNCGNREKLCKYCKKAIPEKVLHCQYCGRVT